MLAREQVAKDRIKKAKATRERTKQAEAAKTAANRADKAAKIESQTLGRAARAARGRTTPMGAAEKRKRNNNASPKAQTSVVKRERNNNALPNKQPTKMTKLTSFKPPPGMPNARRVEAALRQALRNKKSSPSRQQGLNSIPESGQFTGTPPARPQPTPSRRETRSASAARLRRNAPASAGTRSRARTPGSAQVRTSSTTR